MSLSQSAANAISYWANIFLIVSLVIGVISTSLVTWTSNAKEEYLRLQLAAQATETANARLKIAELETHGKQLERDTAEANARAEQARLSLSQAQIGEIIKSVRSYSGQHFSGMVAASVPDAPGLWRKIDHSLRQAGWHRENPWGLAIGTPPAGVPALPSDGITIFVPHADRFKLLQTAEALGAALKKAELHPFVQIDNSPQARSGILVIEIGTKPAS